MIKNLKHIKYHKIAISLTSKIESSSKIAILLILLSSCKLYKQDLMFQLDDQFNTEDLSSVVNVVERNYALRKGDFLRVDVFTNGGERIIDPNFELMSQGGGAINQQQNNIRIFQYLVQQDGMVKLPVLGVISLEGLTINEAETKLEQLYNQYYKGSFVKLQYLNKRVVVLGANGGQVIPLMNENMSLLEIIALSGGVGANAKAQNIRLIRSKDSGMEVFQINLSTVSAMKDSLIPIESGDVIYIEPWKRPVQQSLRDASPVISIISSVLTLYLVIQNL